MNNQMLRWAGRIYFILSVLWIVFFIYLLLSTNWQDAFTPGNRDQLKDLLFFRSLIIGIILSILAMLSAIFILSQKRMAIFFLILKLVAYPLAVIISGFWQDLLLFSLLFFFFDSALLIFIYFQRRDLSSL